MVGLPFTTNVPDKPAPTLARREADQIAVLAEALVVLGGICSGRGGALGEDDEETGKGDGDERRDIAPGHALWQAESGQTAGHRAQRRDAFRGEVEEIACGDHADNRDQRARNIRREALAANDQREHDERDEQGGQARLRELLDVGDELLERAAPAPWESEHPRDLADGDLDTDTGQEADQHRAREEVRQESQPDEAGDEQDRGGDQRQESRQSDILR